MYNLKRFLKNNLVRHLTIPNYLIVVCFITIAVIIGMLFFQNNLISYDKYLLGFYNIFAFITLLFTVIAALIASLAYKNSLLRPNLKLEIYQYDSHGKENLLPVNQNTNKVLLSRPRTEWFLTMYNTGKVSAKYPVVQVIFKGQYFGQDSFAGWEQVLHAHGSGYYGFQWNPKDTIIYPGLPVKLPTLYFSGKQIRAEKGFDMIFKYAADGCSLTEHVISIELEYYDHL